MTPSPFRDVPFDPDLYRKVLKKPAADLRYVIYFTPRSGSSWLTDILSQTGKLSKANEAFNPNFIPNIARVCNASNLEQYINVLIRRHNQGGVYGFEITMHQFEAVFPGPELFLEHFGAGPCFWRIRRDIVAQAVSLAKMVTTSVAHTSHATAEARQASDSRFEYDAELIRRWLSHILSAERKNEAFFARHGLDPLRLCYEQTTCLSAQQMVDVVSRHLGLPDLPRMNFETKHEKLGTSRNEEFAARFRRDEAAFMAEVDAERGPWLARLHDITLPYEDV
jgi:LPS sulfotransferase NodH